MKNIILKKILFFLALYLNISSVCFAEEIDVFKLVEHGTPQQLQVALKQGVNFNVERNMSDFDEDKFEVPDYWPFDTGETPLHRAAAYNNNPESIKFLIEQGLDVNTMAYAGLYSSMNPLACALFCKNSTAAQELLKAGANPNAWIDGGYNFLGTPCHIIALVYNDNLSDAKEIITAIVKAGGDINSHEELSSDEIKDFSESEHEFAKYKTLFIPREQWNDNDPCSNMRSFSHITIRKFLATLTPLMWAVLCDNYDVVNILLDFNADVNIRSVENKSAVDYADDLPKNSKIKKSLTLKRLQSNASPVFSKTNNNIDINSAESSEAVFKIVFEFPNRISSDIAQINDILSTLPLSNIDIADNKGYLEAITYYDNNTQSIKAKTYRYGFDKLHLICKRDNKKEKYCYKIDTSFFTKGKIKNVDMFSKIWHKEHPKRIIKFLIKFSHDDGDAFVIFHHEKKE